MRLSLLKSKPAHSEHAQVALYRFVLLMYPYLLCGIKTGLLREVLLPGCKAMPLPSLENVHGAESNTSGTELIVAQR